VRSGTYPSEKCPTHGVGIAEPAPGGHPLQRNIGILQQSARGIETRGFNVVGGGNPGLALKNAGKISHTHRRAIGKRCNGKILSEVVKNPVLHTLDAGLAGDLSCQMRAEYQLQFTWLF
jgi:hypothetical protein